jgi:ABC-type multidrug transport system ATPase subunit
LNVLATFGLAKRYGQITAVRSLDLTVPAGSVFGVLGPNGSGKTTVLGIVLGAIQPSRGRYAWFDGHEPRFAPRRIGALLEAPAFYPSLSGAQNLQVIARIRGRPWHDIDDALSRAGLSARRHSPVQTYSLGMRQRLALAAALLGRPDVVVLDEPCNGLDPEGIAEVRNVIGRVVSGGTTVILASHVLDEVQRVCSHIAVLKEGRLLAAGAVDRIVHGAGRRTLEETFLDLVSAHAPPD